LIAAYGVVGLSLVGVATLPSVLATPSPVGASSIGSLQAEAAAIAAQIDTQGTKINILSEEYDEAQTRVGELRKQVAVQSVAIKAAARTLQGKEGNLRSQAILAYVDDGANQGDGASAVLTNSQDIAPLQQAYLQVASGSLSQAVNAVELAKRALQQRWASLEATDAVARHTAKVIAADAASAKLVSAQLYTTWSEVKGQLAAAVAAQLRAQQAAAAAAATAAAAAAAAAQPPPPPPVVAPPTTPPATTPPATPPAAPTPSTYSPPSSNSGSSAGEIALHAAESQIGVPYVWGGATPGVGFDCSGLTMWAWGQAGVSLAHGATAQYYEIQHIPMPPNDPTEYLEPGDLIFFGDAGYLYHVVMYGGNGQIIQAEETGTTIGFSSLSGGWYGAGRP
jgi:cell wall-associated NlpC family hydrolase